MTDIIIWNETTDDYREVESITREAFGITTERNNGTQ